jgi:kinesin family protein 2/24
MRGTPSKDGQGRGDGGVRRSAKVDPTVQKIENLRLQREERRRAAEAHKVGREAENTNNEKMGRPGDVDFQRMIDLWRAESVGKEGVKALKAADMKICICVRKRPVNQREVRLRDYDSVSCMNPFTIVHGCKLRVDGITKYLDNTDFRFDYSFSEESTTDDVYLSTTAPLVEYIFRKGRSTVFAYGQTGSGKTYTMAGIQRLAAHDVFRLQQTHERTLQVFFGYFEIYGGRCQDLLNQRKRLNIREDGKVCVHHTHVLTHCTHTLYSHTVLTKGRGSDSWVGRDSVRDCGGHAAASGGGEQRANDTRDRSQR